MPIFSRSKTDFLRAVYEICEEPLSLLGHEPEEGWMKFTYQYVCHILYPDAEFKKENAAFSAGAEFYLAVLQFVFDRERAVLPYKPMEDFAFLGDEEASSFECAAEYSRFKKFFAQEYIYEMMRLNAEVTPFRTLEHIAGVHYVAMTVARGLYAAGVPIDLTLTSGAAAGHDLGNSAASRMSGFRIFITIIQTSGLTTIRWNTSVISRRTIRPGIWNRKTCR